MKKVYKTAAVISILFLICFVMCSCSKKVSEKQIVKEITQQEEIYKNCNLEVISHEIDKRKTDKIFDTDEMTLYITSQNDDCFYSATYSVIYGLYDDGWEFEEYEVKESSYEAKSEPNTAIIEQKLSKEYDSYKLEKINTDVNESTIEYIVTENKYGYLYTYNLILSYEFTPEELWHEIEREEKQIEKKLNIELDSSKTRSTLSKDEVVKNIKNNANTYIQFTGKTVDDVKKSLKVFEDDYTYTNGFGMLKVNGSFLGINGYWGLGYDKDNSRILWIHFVFPISNFVSDNKFIVDCLSKYYGEEYAFKNYSERQGKLTHIYDWDFQEKDSIYIQYSAEETEGCISFHVVESK